jgi:hypothetical protein
MTKWIFAAIVFGIFGTMFAIGSLTSANAVYSQPFLVLASSRHGTTTSDRASAMTGAAVVSGVLCLGCVGAALRARRAARRSRVKDSDARAWTCAHCHEKNPENFEECWKCQRNR